MSGWEGLHNHEAHKSLPPTEHEEAVPACLDCESWCDESMPCRCCLAAEVERLTARAEAAEAERDALRDKVDLALDIPMRIYFEGSVSPAEAEWHRGWNDAVTALHDAINPELVDDDPDEGDAAMGGADG